MLTLIQFNELEYIINLIDVERSFIEQEGVGGEPTQGGSEI
jgi:hypothetical protein